MIAAIILAAGRSTRMPSHHKLLRKLGPATVLATTVARVTASAADRVFVVLGHEAGRIAASLPPSRATPVTASDHAAGMAASLRAGLAACPPETRGVLVCLGDMPLLHTATIDALIGRFRTAHDAAAIVAPIHAGTRGHPVLWGRAHLAALAALEGDTGGRALLQAHALTGVAVDDPGTLLDIDTEAALAAARAMVGG